MKAGPGRPKGSKDRSYLTLQFWYDELRKDWPRLKPAQRAKLSAQLMQMLVNKMKHLPSSPDDSVMNAAENQAFLDSLEAKLKPITNDQDKDLEPRNPSSL